MIIIPSNSKIIAKPDKPIIEQADRVKDGIHVTFNTSGYDFGGIDSIKVNYNCTSLFSLSPTISNEKKSFRKKFPLFKIIIFRLI